MKTKFTKGNWIINPTEAKDDNGNPLYYDIAINSENGVQSFISTIPNHYLGISIDESLYNAKIIAAAPEMLYMLKDSIEALEWYMKNTTPDNQDWQSFHDLGMNIIVSGQELINKATE